MPTANIGFYTTPEGAAALDDVSILNDVIVERARQERKFGPQHGQTVDFWLLTIMEEVGECANEAQQLHHGKPRMAELRAELVQVAALAVRLIGKIDRDELAGITDS